MCQTVKCHVCSGRWKNKMRLALMKRAKLVRRIKSVLRSLGFSEGAQILV